MQIGAKKFGLVILVASALTGHAQANNTWTTASANDVVQEYKVIRSACAKSQGDQRRRCFAKLSKLTENYKGAKQFLENKVVPKTDLAAAIEKPLR